jgi:hypothetical protein
MYKDYISKNLCINKDKPHNCCQGKCYLADQVKKNTEPIESTRDTNKKIVPDKITEDHLKAESNFTLPVAKTIILTCFYSLRITNTFSSPLFVPPEL